jgi:hypothetical protein
MPARHGRFVAGLEFGLAVPAGPEAELAQRELLEVAPRAKDGFARKGGFSVASFHRYPPIPKAWHATAPSR